MMFRHDKAAVTSLLLLVLSACGGSGNRINTMPPPSDTGRVADVDAALALLLQGDEGAARKQLKAIVKRDPNNASAQMLLATMKGDAREQLGPQNYPYTVRAGDTIDQVAQRLLGNRLKAYQLLRYNGLSAPATLATGQVLRIPGEMPRAEPRRPAKLPPRATTPPPATVARPKPAAPPATTANPAAARQARAAGLAALNQGKVAEAVAQLRRAAALDPGNPLIARDLSRAQRIAATVRTRR